LLINTYENWGRVGYHLSGGVTMIEFTDSTGRSLNLPWFQADTESIPRSLRPIGSLFLFQWDAIAPELSDTAEELRARRKSTFRIMQPQVSPQ